MSFYFSLRIRRNNLFFHPPLIFLKLFLILLIIFCENRCWTQQSHIIYQKFIITGLYIKGNTYSYQLEQSHHAAKLEFEYYLDKNKSINFDFFYGKDNESKIPYTFFEKGLRSVRFSYFINSFIVREFDQAISFASAFGGECVSFKNTKGYHLKGHSVLVRPSIFIDSNQLIPFLKYNFSIANSLSIGIFRGELKPINNENTYNCSFYRLSIESGFHFPIYKKISVLLLYLSDLFGEEISCHSYNLGISYYF